MLKEFKEFALRGNVLDLAVGVIIGAAFARIVSSFVNDILMPPLGLVLGGGDLPTCSSISRGTLCQPGRAQAAGAPTINYGLFIKRLLIS